MANLIDHIGAIHICVTDPKKSYIVGASDAANKEFQDSFGVWAHAQRNTGQMYARGA